MGYKSKPIPSKRKSKKSPWFWIRQRQTLSSEGNGAGDSEVGLHLARPNVAPSGAPGAPSDPRDASTYTTATPKQQPDAPGPSTQPASVRSVKVLDLSGQEPAAKSTPLASSAADHTTAVPSPCADNESTVQPNVRPTARSSTPRTARPGRRRSHAKSVCRRGIQTFFDKLINAHSPPTPDQSDQQPGSAPRVPPSRAAPTPCDLSGNRIVDMEHFRSEMNRLDEHNPATDCRMSDMEVVRETRRGLCIAWTYKCKMCNLEEIVWSQPQTKKAMSINMAATAGTVLTGGGHAQLAQQLALMNMPSMDHKTFAKCEQDLFRGWQAAALDLMKKAVEEEIEHARRLGHVDENGIPLLTVTVDGSWPKRSSRTNYSSLSGMAAIVGVYSQKVLYFGWRNKFCVVCQRAKSRKEAPNTHSCFVNWTGSATGMESDIILEGFRSSEEMYGVRYKWFVGDGDSSTNKKILDQAPYDNCEVEKIECSNHLLRNFCYHLEEITKKGDNQRQKERGSTLGFRLNIRKNILKMRIAVKKAAEYWRNNDSPLPERVIKLKKDILNCPRHVFGDHRNCGRYFCDGKRKPFETNIVTALQKNFLWAEIYPLFDKLANHSRSLIHCLNNNAVENLNSIICKFLGGKRKNFTQRGSYSMRVTAAAVSKNSGEPFRAVHKQLCEDSSPGKFAKTYEENAVKKRLLDNRRLARIKRLRRVAHKDADYGDAIQRVYRVKDDVLEELKEEASRRDEIEEQTRLQGLSNFWKRLRLYRITASNFGKVCKRGKILCDNLVISLLYSSFKGNDATDYGNRNESIAIEQYCKDTNTKVKKAGLFIDKTLHFLAASPDGIFSDGEGLIEVKCPAACANITPEEAVRKKTDVAFKIDKTGKIAFDRNHNHHYQMQGQMHIADKAYCVYLVWTSKGYMSEIVLRDSLFWKTKMEEQLTKFYYDCVLVEIVEQNFLLGKPIKNPEYLINASKTKKQSVKTNKRNQIDNGKDAPPSKKTKKQT